MERFSLLDKMSKFIRFDAIDFSFYSRTSNERSCFCPKHQWRSKKRFHNTDTRMAHFGLKSGEGNLERKDKNSGSVTLDLSLCSTLTHL